MCWRAQSSRLQPGPLESCSFPPARAYPPSPHCRRAHGRQRGPGVLALRVGPPPAERAGSVGASHPQESSQTQFRRRARLEAPHAVRSPPPKEARLLPVWIEHQGRRRQARPQRPQRRLMESREPRARAMQSASRSRRGSSRSPGQLQLSVAERAGARAKPRRRLPGRPPAATPCRAGGVRLLRDRLWLEVPGRARRGAAKWDPAVERLPRQRSPHRTIRVALRDPVEPSLVARTWEAPVRPTPHPRRRSRRQPRPRDQLQIHHRHPRLQPRQLPRLQRPGQAHRYCPPLHLPRPQGHSQAQGCPRPWRPRPGALPRSGRRPRRCCRCR
jgi:hypothetical protein